VTNRVYVMTFLVVPVLAALAQSQTFTTLYNFTGGSDGGFPTVGVVQDPAGNLYGTTISGAPVAAEWRTSRTRLATKPCCTTSPRRGRSPRQR
jgi:hypothetical protein